MLISILLGVILFGYAGWTLNCYIRRSREGKCAACELNKHCSGSCSSPRKRK